MTTSFCCWSTIGLYSKQEITTHKSLSLVRVKYVSGTALRSSSWFSAIPLIIGAHGIAWQAWRTIIPAKFVRMTSDQYIYLWQNRQNKHAHKSLRKGRGNLKAWNMLVIWSNSSGAVPGALLWCIYHFSHCTAILLATGKRRGGENTGILKWGLQATVWNRY